MDWFPFLIARCVVDVVTLGFGVDIGMVFVRCSIN